MFDNIEMIILIQTLVAAEQGSFQKAGLLLGVPACTVSRRVRSLGTELSTLAAQARGGH